MLNRSSKTSKIRRALRNRFPIIEGKPPLVERIEDINTPLEIASKQAGYTFDEVCLYIANNPHLGLLTDYRRHLSGIKNRNRPPKYH